MLKLEARAQASDFWRIASPLLALVVTVVIGVILFIALGKDPLKGLEMFFWLPIKSAYAVGELLVDALPPVRQLAVQGLVLDAVFATTEAQRRTTS